MRWPTSFTRNTLIGVALLTGLGTAFFLVRREPPTLIGCSPAGSNTVGDADVWIDLTFKDFHPAGNQFTGAASLEIHPRLPFKNRQEFQDWAAQFHQVVFRFEHFGDNQGTFQGGGDAPVFMTSPPAWGSLMGKDNFSWNAVPGHGAFYYPFDTYKLYVNPVLIQVPAGEVNAWPSRRIDSLNTDFGSSNFIPHLIPLQAKSVEDPYEITLERPLLLRVMAAIVTGLLLIWLLYLIVAAKPGEYVGQVVTLFVGVFSIRNSLLSGAPVFPSLVDYCSVGVYLAAVLIILVKSGFPDRKTIPCPWCTSPISPAAQVCPQCTRSIA